MPDYLEKFEFDEKPNKITYKDGEPLKLNKEFRFYHNKHRFRKDLNELQLLFQENLQYPLHIAGIRDSYVKAEYTESYLFTVMCTPETITNTTKMVEEFTEKEIGKSCYYIQTSSDYLLIIAKNYEGIKKGINRTHEILKKILDDYFQRQNFEEFIKIRPFTLYDCR